MTIRLKERELIAVGISVAAGCRPCTDCMSSDNFGHIEILDKEVSGSFC